MCLTPAREQVFNTVKIKREGYAQCLVERVACRCGNYIAGIERENIHSETCTNRKVLTVTFHLVLVVITCAQRKFIVIGVFHTNAPLYFFEFLAESAGSVAKALENTGYR